MSASRFFDTNVFVYAFDRTEPDKARIARELISGPDWQVSWQVVQEFANVALHRFATPMEPGDLGDYLELVLWPNCGVYPSAVVARKALSIHRRTGYRFSDSLIVASALAGGATVVVSEDLQDGREIDGLRIENPFRGS